MDEKIQTKLKDLLIQYQKNLPDKIVSFEQQWQELQQQWDPEKMETLHRDIHSLCGSSGTYGYVELSKIARQAEIYLKENLLKADEITEQQQKIVTTYLNQLKVYASVSINEPNVQLKAKPNPVNSKLVYIVEKSKALCQELIENLSNMGYQPYPIQDIITLAAAFKEQSPVALIINCDFLDADSIELLNQRQKSDQSIQLFCLVPNANLLPRLNAVRAGCDAFFQLPIDISHFNQVFHNKCDISTESFRILIVDDSKTLTDYYSLILNQAGMIAKAITNPMQLLDVIKEFQPDLLLMDIYMPECTGLELAAILRQEKNYTKIPIIFLSTEVDTNKKLFAISLGGDDFLTKPVSPQHLISAIRSRVKRANVLNYYMVTDSLTGLLNHSSILKQLEIEIARALQKNTSLSVIMADIDFFKKINDEYGHPAGDKVIKQLANLFLVYLRGQDIVGRYGGEEFILILPGTNIVNAEKICNDLRVQFSQYIFKEQEKNFSVTFSSGISFLKHKEEAAHLIKEADDALYLAKHQGRNQVVVFDK